ncbi:MAG: OsmC family protein [Clostridia bacterium]|nr:OsmC family protein [Clostridia bacterium]
MGKYFVTAKNESKSKTIVKARHFNIIIDEPTEIGGTDFGPNPVEYLLASYCGCINVVGNVVARQMQLNLKGIEIKMEGELDPAKLMGKPTEERAGYKKIFVTVIPDIDADRETIQKWLDAVEQRCPVGDNIANSTPIEIKLG